MSLVTSATYEMIQQMPTTNILCSRTTNGTPINSIVGDPKMKSPTRRIRIPTGRFALATRISLTEISSTGKTVLNRRSRLFEIDSDPAVNDVAKVRNGTSPLNTSSTYSATDRSTTLIWKM